MNLSDCVLCVEKKNVNFVNDLNDVVYEKDALMWEAKFQNDGIVLKSVWQMNKNCTLYGEIMDTDCQQEFNKNIKVVYKINEELNDCPYGGKLVIFDDLTFIWMTYGCRIKYMDVSVGYISTVIKIRREIVI